MKRQAKKGFVAIAGSIVVVAGIIMIPYPGPGWLVVFAGLGILSTEFTWAARTLTYAKGNYDSWVKWVTEQSTIIRSVIGLGTAATVVVTIWLMNGYGMLNDVFDLGVEWLESPLPIF
jgi:uncharacterized protein (TIGR02611 family)